MAHFDLTDDIHSASDLGSRGKDLQSLVDELELLRDIRRGLADVEAGRVVPHDEAHARLLARYF